MRIRLAIPDQHLDAPMLNAALEAVTRAAQKQIETGRAPLSWDGIRAGVRWKPESFLDGEHFDLPSTVMARGWGDCDDLGPWHAASLRATGRDPRARARARRSGPQRWHVEVKRGDGSIDDPSRWAGMSPTVSGVDCMGVCGARSIPMAMPGFGALALAPDPKHGLWWGRTDLPWGRSDSHLVSQAASPNAHKALALALRGALLSDVTSKPHRQYARALFEDLLMPKTRRAHMVGFLDSVMDLAKGPLGSAAASLIPGGGMAHSLLSSMIPGGKKPPPKGAPMPAAPGAPAPAGGGGGGGGRPMSQAALPGGGHIAWAPQGPLIVRF
jgi:hypothetical protein